MEPFIKIALVGSRKAPREALTTFRILGSLIASKGGLVATGHAEGIDWAAERGVMDACDTEQLADHMLIVLPNQNFMADKHFDRRNPNRAGFFVPSEQASPDVYARATDIARSVMDKAHWGNLTDSHKALHTRNVFQVLGRDLLSPVDAVFSWCPVTKSGNFKGGTRTALEIAKTMDIPYLNMEQDPTDHTFLEAAISFINGVFLLRKCGEGPQGLTQTLVDLQKEKVSLCQSSWHDAWVKRS